MKHLHGLIAGGALLIAACTGGGDEAHEANVMGDRQRERGAALLAPFKRDLMQALQTGLAEEGPVAAIEVCQVQAPAIAGSYSVDDVRLGRSSHRLRNPSNAPPDWVVPIMDDYAADDAEPAPRSVRLQGDRMGYVEPIILQPLCVTCHGSNLTADVQARIDELYPADAATGFEVGDLRGVFWIEYPMEDQDNVGANR